MSMATEEQDVEFFKGKLYANFRDTGLVDNLKAQLRFKLLEKLQKKDVLNKENIPANLEGGSYQPKKTLLNRVIASLISEYLQKNNYNYSNAVFLPEAGFNNQVLTRSEMVDILKANRLLEGKEDRALMDVLLDYVWSLLEGRDLKVNAGCQTDFDGTSLSLEQKLRTVDYDYFVKNDENRSQNNQTFDERFMRMKREYDAKFKTDLESEIARIRDFEVTALRIEEAEKYRIKMEQYREELEKMYLDKVNKLRERERDTIERCKQQIKNLEAASYEHRQKVLKDLEIQKLKERDWEGHHGLQKENIKGEKDKILGLERDLQRQRREMDVERENMKFAIEKSKDDARKELVKELDHDRATVYQLKASLEADTIKIEQYKSASEGYKSQNERLLQENSQLMEEVQSYRNSRKDADAEITRLRENIESLKTSLKREEDHLKRYEQQVQLFATENDHIKGGLEEYSKLVEQKKNEIMELNQRHMKDIEYYQHEIEKVDKEKDDSRRQQEELKRQIEELKRQLEESKRQQEDLRQQLLEMQQDHVIRADIGVQKDISRSFISNAPRDEPSNILNFMDREPLRQSRQQFSVVESQSDPMQRFHAITREIDELKRKRETGFMFGNYDVERSTKVIEKHDTSSHYSTKSKLESEPKPFRGRDTELDQLRERQKALRNELFAKSPLQERGVSTRKDDSEMMHSDISPVVGGYYEQKNIEKTNPTAIKSDDKFDEMFDKYSDKLTEVTPSQKRSNDFVSTFEPKKNESSSDVKNLFKVDKPKQSNVFETKETTQNTIFENLGKNNSRSAVQDQPKPFMFKNTKNEEDKAVSPLSNVGYKPSVLSTKNGPKLLSDPIKSQKNDLEKKPAAANLNEFNKTKITYNNDPTTEDDVEFEVIEDEDKLFDF